MFQMVDPVAKLSTFTPKITQTKTQKENSAMKKRLVLISVFAIAFLVASQGVVLAKAMKVPVSGTAWINPPSSPAFWIDEGGNTHFDGMSLYGEFHVAATDGSAFEFDGVRLVVVYGLQNHNGTGQKHGPVIVSDEMGSVAWVGQMHVVVVGGYSSGEMILHGVGDYKGMQLKLYVEQQNLAFPKLFLLEGRLMSPHGE
jgi:hypothetical protein